MAVTVASFRAAFPEFAEAADALVQSKLDEVAAALDPRVFGSRLDEAVCYLTAHRLALAPYGQGMRLSAKDSDTVYGAQFAAIQRACAGGPWVVGLL